jgi:hypothetical protein
MKTDGITLPSDSGNEVETVQRIKETIPLMNAE